MQEENKIVAMRYNAKLGEWVEVKEASRFAAAPDWYHKGKCLYCGALKGSKKLTLDLNQSELSADKLEERLADVCPCLESLVLNSTEISDAGLKHIAKLINLKVLNLGFTKKISDVGLKHIAELINLKELAINSTQISDEGLKHIAKLINLQKLNLANTKTSDTGLQYIEGFVNLTYLHLLGTKISDEGLKHIAGLVNLTTLNLWETKISYKGMKHIAGLTKLEVFYTDADFSLPIKRHGWWQHAIQEKLMAKFGPFAHCRTTR